MATIGTERPVFPPAQRGAGSTASAPVSTVKILREAQAAFFRPATHAATAPEQAPEQTKAEAVRETLPVQTAAAPDRAMMRPGSYLNILV